MTPQKTPYRVIVNGANGKMGSVATNTLKLQSDFEVVAELGKQHILENEIQRLSPDFIVDFTHANAIQHNMETILKTKIPSVIGTTGLSAEQITQYKQVADQQQQGIILAPNFSLSVLLMMKYAQDAAHYFDEAEIVEIHSPQKLDAPSGTARRTARMIAQNNPIFQKTKPDADNQARGGMYDDNSIPIHSLRLSGKMAYQEVIFSSIGETLTIQQDTLSRECFMPGFLVACRAITSLNHFVEGLENILWPHH